MLVVEGNFISLGEEELLCSKADINQAFYFAALRVEERILVVFVDVELLIGRDCENHEDISETTVSILRGRNAIEFNEGVDVFKQLFFL